MTRRLGIVVWALLAAAGCKRAAAPAVPDASVEELELAPTPPGEIKDKVNDTLQKEHERTLEPKVE